MNNYLGYQAYCHIYITTESFVVVSLSIDMLDKNWDISLRDLKFSLVVCRLNL